MAANNLDAYSTSSGGVATDVVAAGSIEPALTLAAQFTAAGAGAAVAAPAGVSAARVLTFTSGAPTAAAAVVEGSNDGTTWTALPSSDPEAVFTQIRLHCTALSGGTSPTVTAVAVVTP